MTLDTSQSSRKCRNRHCVASNIVANHADSGAFRPLTTAAGVADRSGHRPENGKIASNSSYKTSYASQSQCHYWWYSIRTKTGLIYHNYDWQHECCYTHYLRAAREVWALGSGWNMKPKSVAKAICPEAWQNERNAHCLCSCRSGIFRIDFQLQMSRANFNRTDCVSCAHRVYCGC